MRTVLIPVMGRSLPEVYRRESIGLCYQVIANKTGTCYQVIVVAATN